jgi:hypothetical protein
MEVKPPPHLDPVVLEMSDDDRWDYFQDLFYAKFEEHTPNQDEQIPITMMTVHPLYGGCGPCSMSHESYTMSFVSAKDALDYLAEMLIGSTPPLGKREHVEIMKDVYGIVEKHRATSPNQLTPELVQELNSATLNLIELEIFEAETLKQQEELFDCVIGPLRAKVSI